MQVAIIPTQGDIVLDCWL